MNRRKANCPCCSQQVELYTDGLSGGGFPFRCGNCFHGFDEEDLERAAALNAILQKHRDEMDKAIKEALRGGL